MYQSETAEWKVYLRFIKALAAHNLDDMRACVTEEFSAILPAQPNQLLSFGSYAKELERL